MFPPLPRFRLYTQTWDYLFVMWETLLGRIAHGNSCRDLEKNIAERTESPFALTAPQARVAIYWAVRSLIKPGQEVVLSPYTIFDVVNMVICAGGIPVFADIERETCNINPEEIIKSIGPNTGAVMVTHLHGLACDMTSIVKICQDKNIPLIEDAAQAFGTTFSGQPVGTFGDAGIYSFGLYKNITGFFGGMLLTPHIDVYKQIAAKSGELAYQEKGVLLRRVKDGLVTDVATFQPLFKLFTYWVFRYAFLHNLEFVNKMVAVDLNPRMFRNIPETYLRRMSPLQARLILRKLDLVQPQNQSRIRSAQIYYEGLSDIPEIMVAPLCMDGSHIYSYFPIQVEDRPALLTHLMSEGRDVGAQHLKNCTDLACFKEFFRDCPNARLTANQTILLPTYPQYSQQDIKRNIQSIRKYFGKS